MIYEVNVAATTGDFYLLMALTMMPLFGLVPFWIISLRPVEMPIQSLPITNALSLARATPPFVFIAAFVYMLLDRESISGSMGGAILLHVASCFFLAMANVGVAIGLYYVIIGNRYVIQGRDDWWLMMRLEAWVAGVILSLIGLAFLGGGIALAVIGMSDSGQTILNILSLVSDHVQLVASLYGVGTILYVMWELKKENDILRQGMAKIPLKALAGLILWIARCCYDIVFTLDAVKTDKIYQEPGTMLIPTRIIDFSFPSAVLVLLIIVARDDVWADRILRPHTALPTGPLDVCLYAIRHGLADTFRSFLAVFRRKERAQPDDAPAEAQAAVPMDTWDAYIQRHSNVQVRNYARHSVA